MKKHYKYYIGLLLPWILLAGGCTEAVVPGETGSETDRLVPVVCTLHQEAVTVVRMSDMESETKGVVTKANSEEAINDLAILQFTGTTDNATCITSRYLYKPVPDVGTDQYSIGLRVTADKGYIIFIANAGNRFATYEEQSKTLGDFKKETVELDQKATNDQNVLMIGAEVVQVTTGGSSTPIQISLKRLVARIRFTWEAKPTVTNTEFTPLFLKLRNVPKKLSYMEAITQTDGVYPASSDENFKDYTSIVDRIGDGFTWYIPMNRRGAASNGNIKAWEKTGVNAPDNHCTYIELSGIFKTPNMADQLATYSFYVGGNYAGQNGTVDYNNYSVEANGDYNVNAIIVGVNTFDLRVTKRNFVYSEPANCFMVSPEAGNEVLFNPYKAPGTDVAGSGIVYADQMIEGRYSKIAGVKILWQTSENLIIKASIAQGMVNVVPNKGGISGNALIAAYNEANEILWSWHIWVTPYAAIINDNQDNVRIGTRQSYNNQEWTDRNLGASNTLTLAVPELMYQWGRKDPFLTNYYTSSTVPATEPLTSSLKQPNVFYKVTDGSPWYKKAHKQPVMAGQRTDCF
ncbi:MAG: fimbrial protein [Parabacteroides sp.]|nr:fimbrial protein [Parabacteroides sp.]